ncbi:MAG: helix-hairpin-helix domain-containing protein [Candidatus Thorarchaeota archaeon]
MDLMKVLENEIEIDRKKKTLVSYYEEAKKAISAQNIEQAIDLAEKGRLQAELENNYEWVQRFNSFNSAILQKPLLSTTIMRDDITKVKGVGPSVAEKLREHGFTTIEKLAKSSISQLSNIKGIGSATAQKIVEGAKSLTSRIKLNDFPQSETPSIEVPIHKEVEEYTEEDYKSYVEEVKVQKWFSDKYKKPKTGIWSPPQELNPLEITKQLETIQDDSPIFHEERIDVEDVVVEEDNFKETLQERITSPKLSFIENEPLELKPRRSEVILPLKKAQSVQDENLAPSERQQIKSQIELMFQTFEYSVIKPDPLLKDIFTHTDLIGVKRLKFNDVIDFVIIIPVKVSTLKGQLHVSNETIKYVPYHKQFKENGSAFKILLNSYFDTIQDKYNDIHHDLAHNGNFHSYLKRHYGINISVKKTFTKKGLFFTEGNIELKIFINPILLCQNEVGFLEKDIPFAYLTDMNLHILNQNNLNDLLQFIEKKFTLLETHRKQTHTLISFNELYNQFLKRSTILSIPFIGFGMVLIFLILFQSFDIMKVFLNIGYSLLGIFFIAIPFFYMKVLKPRSEIQVEFSKFIHNGKSLLDETSLVLINEQFNPEMMSQFAYECLGKQHQSKLITKIEQNQIKESIDQKRLHTNVKNGGFFEADIPDTNLKRYSSFLEE